MQTTTEYKEKFSLNLKGSKAIIIMVISILCLGILGAVIIGVNNNNLTTYKELFFDEKYLEAKDYYDNKISNSMMNKMFSSKDKTANFLNEELSNRLKSYEKGDITSEEATTLIKEIKKYNLIDEEALNDGLYKIETTEVVRSVNNLLKQGKDFENTFKAIEEKQQQYPNLEGLIIAKKETLVAIKTTTLEAGKALFDAGKYEEAVAKLESENTFLTGDLEYEETLKGYKAKREEELKRIEEEKRVAEEKIKEEERKKAAAMVVNTNLNRSDFSTSEAFINSTNLSSLNSYLIYVNLQNQTTEVFKGSKGNWNLVYSFISSTGKSDTPTPRGVYKVTGRGSWFFSEQFQQGARWYVQFWGDYLFHSLPMDRNKNVVDPTLGTPASHGCVRLKVDESKWLYDNIPNGATVFIK